MSIKITIDSKRVESILAGQLKKIKSDIPPLLNTAANEIKHKTVAEISANTSLSKPIAEKSISISEATTQSQRAQIDFDTRPIEVTHYNPIITQTAPSKASFTVDFWLDKGAMRIKKSFYNPIKQVFRKRKKDKKAYPIQQIFGPSIARLFSKMKRDLLKEETKVMTNKILNLLEK